MPEGSVLFVPFDATKGHVRRNAGNGVFGYPVRSVSEYFSDHAPIFANLAWPW